MKIEAFYIIASVVLFFFILLYLHIFKTTLIKSYVSLTIILWILYTWLIMFSIFLVLVFRNYDWFKFIGAVIECEIEFTIAALWVWYGLFYFYFTSIYFVLTVLAIIIILYLDFSAREPTSNWFHPIIYKTAQKIQYYWYEDILYYFYLFMHIIILILLYSRWK